MTAHRAHLQVTRPGLLPPRGHLLPPEDQGVWRLSSGSPQEGAPDRPEAGVQPGPGGTFVTPQSPLLTAPPTSVVIPGVR